jgi:hypothetical protein
MKDPDSPLEFSGETPTDWMNWMLTRYWKVEGEPPHYVLIVGRPARVPFHFQAILDSSASVGRVAFDDTAALSTYVEKLLRVEQATSGCEREAILFATDHGPGDPTHYSRQYMAEPLAKYITERLGVPTTLLAAEDATRDGLLSILQRRRPALLYTASHGAGSPGAPQEEQELTNGAIVCQDADAAGKPSLLAAGNVPDVPFIDGGIVFQFACFGCGTPAVSDFNHWLGKDRLNAEADFVASLPKRLLAHPHGPVAFVGHVDLAWLHAFDDPDSPDLDEAWHPRMAPFVSAVSTLLSPQPVGLAMERMNERFDQGNALMASMYDRQKEGTFPDRPDARRRLVQAFITRSDAQNYMVLGDPAVYVRMSDGT